MFKESPIIISLGSNPQMSQRIADNLALDLSPVTVTRFADGEQYVELGQDCRNKSVFLIQSTSQPDSNFITLALAVDAARRASAKEIVAVIPYFGYSRQERKSLPRTPISARVFATFLETLGVDRIVTMDLHAKAIEGFFLKTIVDHIYGRENFIKALSKDFSKEISENQIVVVAPDTGAANNARSFAVNFLNSPHLAIVSKGRIQANIVSSMELVGDVKGKVAVIVDDIADTCETLVKSAELLLDNGATKVVAVITHGIFSGDALKKIQDSKIHSLYVSDTVEGKDFTGNVKLVTMSNVFGEIIKSVANSDPIK